MDLPAPPPLTSLPLVCAVVLATQAERRCWVPERPGRLEVTSSRGRCRLATAFRLYLLPRLPLIPILGFPDCQALAGGDISAGALLLGSQVITGVRAPVTRGGLQDARSIHGAWRSGGHGAGCARALRVLGRKPRGAEDTHGRHLAGPGNSGRWPAFRMGLWHRWRETGL
ncbi:hypothetical protein HispidOSU_020398 [Sigmodon hispidus]